jgi:integrase
MLLTAEQYRALGSALAALSAKRTKNDKPAHHPYGLAAIRFIALSGVRRGEAVALRWQEVDVAGSCLRLADSKTGESVRPLGEAALAVVKSVERISDHVFAAGADEEGYQGLPRLWKLVQSQARPEGLAEGEAGPLDDVTLHGLRHSFAGTADELGCSLPTIAAMIGHKLSGVTSGYVLKRLDRPLIAAADRVSGHITAMMDGRLIAGDNVVAISSAV